MKQGPTEERFLDLVQACYTNSVTVEDVLFLQRCLENTEEEFLTIQEGDEFEFRCTEAEVAAVCLEAYVPPSVTSVKGITSRLVDGVPFRVHVYSLDSEQAAEYSRRVEMWLEERRGAQ